MSLYMETTKIPAIKTVGEIQSLLGSSGKVRAVQTEYGPGGDVSALSFVISVNGAEVPFRLPARVDPVFRCLQRKRSINFRGRKEAEDREQAVRVAWRQILRWIQAQLALVETGMVTMHEIFLPYMQVGLNETLTDRVSKAIETGKIRGLLAE